MGKPRTKLVAAPKAMTNRQIQQALIDLGFDVGRHGVDGDIGRDSERAVRAYQGTVGLNRDGVPGPFTQRALTASLATLKLALSPVTAGLKAPVVEPPWLVLARGLVGLKEGPGLANNPEVVKLFALAGFPGIKTDETAWCAAFVNGMLEQSGYQGSRSLMARSFDGWGAGLKEPMLGCIATKKRAGKNAPSWQGHCFFVTAANKTHVYGVGGNQGDKVSYAEFKRAEIIAYRWPIGAPPCATKLPTGMAGAAKAQSEA